MRDCFDFVFKNYYSVFFCQTSPFRMKKLLLLFLLFPVFTVSAQERKPIQLSGFVRNINKEALPYVHILIKNSRRGTISDFYGYFSFVVQEKDTILFSYIGYKREWLIIPNNIDGYDFSVDMIMERDTIMLRETKIFPWMNYEQFKEAFVKNDIPDDDLERARKNIELAKLHEKLDQTVYPETAYKQYSQMQYDKLYYKGQLTPNYLLDPLRWAKFFQALKNGDFKWEKEE